MTVTLNRLDEIRKAYQQFVYESSTESRLVAVGLQEEQNMAAIVERFSWLADLETVREVAAAASAAQDPLVREGLSQFAFELTGMHMGSRLVKESDALNNAVVQTLVVCDGERVPYHGVASRLLKEPSFAKREAWGEAVLAVEEQFNPRRAALLSQELDMMATLFQAPDYQRYYEDHKRINLSDFYGIMAPFLDRTEGAYHEQMERWIQSGLGRSHRGLRSSHVGYLYHHEIPSDWFPADQMAESLARTLAGWGIQLAQQTQIHIDVEDRPKKVPRAFCAAPRIPEEIHLVIRPAGGFMDYKAFFHEAGHAEHFAHVDPALSFERRHLGRSNAFTEMFSYLFDHVVTNRAWLMEMLGLTPDQADHVRDAWGLMEWYMVRRYLGKLRYELAFFRSPLPIAERAPLYSESLSRATGLMAPAPMYLADMDGGYYSADYLRAWVGQAQMEAHFEARYGERWWADRRIGDWLKSVCRDNGPEDAEGLLRSLGLTPWDIAPLERRYRTLFQRRA